MLSSVKTGEAREGSVSKTTDKPRCWESCMLKVFHTNAYWDVSDLSKHCLTLERVACFAAIWHKERFSEGLLLAGTSVSTESTGLLHPLFILSFPWYIFLHPFTNSLFMSLLVRKVSHRHHIF